MKIVMVVSSLKCFKNFLNYYNNSNEDFIFLVDTRYSSNQEIIDIIKNQNVIQNYQIILSNQIFNDTKAFLSYKEESVAERIFYFHPVAIKFLIYPYLIHVLKIEKFFLIDDDVFSLSTPHSSISFTACIAYPFDGRKSKRECIFFRRCRARCLAG